MPTIELIKQLRDLTYAPISDCKKALEESNDDLETAQKALVKMGRGTTRAVRPMAGRIAICEAEISDAKVVGMAIVRTETDFVANSEVMESAIRNVVDQIADGFASREDIETYLRESTYQFGEKIELGTESKRIGVDYRDGLRCVTYLHFNKQRAAYVIYKLLGENDPVECANRIAIQCVAANPKYLSQEQMSQAEINQEIESDKADAINQGKSEQVATSIAFGKLHKKFKEIILLDQPMFDNDSLTVKQYAEQNQIEIVEYGIYIV